MLAQLPGLSWAELGCSAALAAWAELLLAVLLGGLRSRWLRCAVLALALRLLAALLLAPLALVGLPL